jgi:MFS family permease
VLRNLAIDTRPLRESRDFRRLWLGQAVSYLGNMVTFVAVPFQLYQLTHSTLQVGLLSICDAVPLLLFAAVGGTIADRLDRRTIVFWSELGLAAVAVLAAVPSLVRYDSKAT